MSEPNSNYEANLFLYDLDNRASEHWFKPDEKWELVVSTAEEKAALEKTYFPVVSLEGSYNFIKAVTGIVNERLNPFKEIDLPGIKGNEQLWLLAYNPLRLRT